MSMIFVVVPVIVSGMVLVLGVAELTVTRAFATLGPLTSAVMNSARAAPAPPRANQANIEPSKHPNNFSNRSDEIMIVGPGGDVLTLERGSFVGIDPHISVEKGILLRSTLFPHPGPALEVVQGEGAGILRHRPTDQPASTRKGPRFANNDLSSRLSASSGPTGNERSRSCLAATRVLTPTSRSARPSTSRRATKKKASPRRRPRAEPGRRSTRNPGAARNPGTAGRSRPPRNRHRSERLSGNKMAH